MALPIPNLDDRSYNDLMNEAQALIPVYNKDWTNHNPSDPGITLLELFAWLTEMVIYRVNQVPEANYRNFLKLIGVDYLFCWDGIRREERLDQPELSEDELKLLAFLEDNYDLGGLKTASITQSDDGDTIFIVKDQQRISFKRTKLSGGNYQAIMNLGMGITEEFSAKVEAGYLFNWDNVPGNETYRLLEFLIQNYAVHWVATAAVWKSVDKKTITITNYLNAITLKQTGDPAQPNRITMEFDIGNRFQFALYKEPGALFDWNKVPGEDNWRVLDLLTQNYGVIWGSKVGITKSVNGKMITLKDSDHMVLLNISDSKDRITVTFVVQNETEYQFITQWNLKDVFDWTNIPGNDNEKLFKFLIQNYGVLWVKTATIGNAGKIVIEKPKDPMDENDFSKRIILAGKGNPGQVELYFEAGNVFEFSLMQEPEYLFDWNKITGRDASETTKLLDFLYQNYSDAFWVKTLAVDFNYDTNQQVRISPAEPDGIIQDNIILEPSDDGTLVNVTFSRKNFNYEFTVKKKFEHFFSEDLFWEKPAVELDWNRLPGTENVRLLDFLSRNYACAKWAEDAKVSLKDGKVTITPAPVAVGTGEVVPLNYEIQLERVKILDNPDQDLRDDSSGNDQYQIIITFRVGEHYQFTVQRRQESFYSTGLLPEEDRQRLKNYLTENYCLDWIQNAEMICEDAVKTITVFYGDKLVVLRLDENADVANMIFNAGNTYQSCIQSNDNRVLVYQKLEKDIYQGLRSISAGNRVITTKDFEVVTLDYMNQLRPNLAGRVICIDNRDLEYAGPDLEKPGHISIMIIPREYQGGEFCWDNIPDNDRDRDDLLQFLLKVYSADWIRKARVRKSENGEKVVVFDDYNSITLAMDDYQKKIILTRENKDPLFIWQQVPGGDDYKLLEMLVRDYNWGEFSQVDIQKISPTQMRVILKSAFTTDRKITLRIIDDGNAERLEDEKPIMINGAESLWEMNQTTGMVIRRVPDPINYELPVRRDMEKRLYLQVDYQYKLVNKKPKIYWDDIPGNGEAAFLDALAMIYLIEKNENLIWLESAAVEKSLDGNLIRVSNGDNLITVQTGDNIKSQSIPRMMIARDDELIMLEINGKAMEYQQEQNRISISAKTDTIKPLNVYAYCVNEGRPSNLLRSLVYRHLDSKRLLTTRVHVVAANYREVQLEAQLVLIKNVNETKVLAEAQAKIEKYFDPVAGGPEGNGWPIGRGLYRSEIYGLLEGINGVDHVSRVFINGQEMEPGLEIAKDNLVSVELTIGTEKRYYE